MEYCKKKLYNLRMDCVLIIMLLFCLGLKGCYWPGRNQRFSRDRVTYYLDGAHTPRSMRACQKWFEEVATQEAIKINGNVSRILVFNSTGDRDEHSLIQPLVVSCIILYVNVVMESQDGQYA